ncbi:hypothetical protein EBU99_12300 [bacterium]|nr:hypothetical protein [bacterium]
MGEEVGTGRVLLICKKNSNSALYKRALQVVDLEVDTVENLADVEGQLSMRPAKAFVHSLEGFERTETTQFHFNFCRGSHAATTHRFMIYRANNMRAVAFSLDCGMQKAVACERAAHTLGHTVNLCLEAGKNRDELQELGLGIATSGRVDLSAEESGLVEKAYKAFPNDPIIRVAQARIHLQRGEYPMAVELSRRLLQAEPYNVRAMTILGEVQAKMGEMELALKLLKKADELSAGNPDRLATLGQICIQSGLYIEGKAYLLTGLRLFPHIQTLRNSLTLCPLETNDFSEVLLLLKNVVTPEGLVSFASDVLKPIVLMRRFDVLNQSVAIALQEFSENSQKCKFLHNLAIELKEMGAKNEAVALLRRCLELDPKFPGAGDLLIKIQTNLAA